MYSFLRRAVDPFSPEIRNENQIGWLSPALYNYYQWQTNEQKLKSSVITVNRQQISKFLHFPIWYWPNGLDIISIYLKYEQRFFISIYSNGKQAVGLADQTPNTLRQIKISVIYCLEIWRPLQSHKHKNFMLNAFDDKLTRQAQPIGIRQHQNNE